MDEIAAQIVVAAEAMPWVEGVYALAPSAEAAAHPDAVTLAVVLAPYRIRDLVKTHYAIVSATGGHDARVMYVNGAASTPVPMRGARRVRLAKEARERAAEQVSQNRARAAEREARDAEILHLDALARALFGIAERAERELAGRPATRRAGRAPYRFPAGKPLGEYTDDELRALVESALDGSAVVASVDGVVVGLEVAGDPFEERRRRVLVADADPSTIAAVRSLDVETVIVSDGWAAVDAILHDDVDLALVPLAFPDGGDPSGPKVHRLVRASRPELAARIVFVASPRVGAEAPPSAAGRVLSRPVSADAVRALLRTPVE